MAARERVAEIDWLKGAAILCVVLIHAEALAGAWISDVLLNRAVPVFAVLFGLNAESWWSARSGGALRGLRWYGTRVRRILVPTWVSLALWWGMVFSMAPAIPHSAGYVLASAVGYAPWVGASWFLTLVIELIVLFPLLRFVVDRVGLAVASAAGAACTVLCWIYLGEVTRTVQWWVGGMVPTPDYFFWIFAPRFFWHVIAGVAVARLTSGRPGMRVVVVAAAVFAAGTAVREFALDHPFHRSALQALLDVPLTLALLGGFRLFGLLPARVPVLAWLAWLGVSSWGVYLGQLLGHNAVLLSGNWSRIDTTLERWLYFAALTAVAAALAAGGDELRRRARVL